MLDIIFTLILSCLSFYIIQKKQIGFYTKQSKLCIYFTIPIVSLLYSSLLADVITSNFQIMRTIVFVITIMIGLLQLIIVYPSSFLTHFGPIESSIIGIMVHLVILFSISSFIPTQQSVFNPIGLMEKVSIIGIFISSILSGISSISIPMKHLDPFHKKYTEEETITLFAELKLMEQRNETRSELYKMKQKEYLIMSKSIRASKKKKGVVGIYNRLYGSIMTVYCIYRFINSILHMLNIRGVDGSSWISKFLSFLTTIIHLNIDWNKIGHFISFFMIGILVTTGINGILSKAFKIILSVEQFSSQKFKGSIIVLICYFITMYSLSFIIMSRSHLVASSHSVIYTTFSSVNYNSYTKFSDLFFFISACCSFLYYYVKNRYGFFISSSQH